MRSIICVINGLVKTSLVRQGDEWYHPSRGHIAEVVYTEMLLQISRDYPGLPDSRYLKFREIRFFYNGLRNELKEHTK